MSVLARVLLGLLALVISAHVHVMVYVAGIPVHMAALWLILPVASAVAAACVWVAYGVPRCGWPRLYWNTT